MTRKGHVRWLETEWSWKVQLVFVNFFRVSEWEDALKFYVNEVTTCSLFWEADSLSAG